MADKLDDLQTMRYFEYNIRAHIRERLSKVDDWWNACIPHQVRIDAEGRHQSSQKINDVLNKPDYTVADYLAFDGYERIITRRDNWRDYFADVFHDEHVFKYKMGVLLNLRNDIMHGRKLNDINCVRLRLHCCDILSEICEVGCLEMDYPDMVAKMGFGPARD